MGCPRSSAALPSAGAGPDGRPCCPVRLLPGIRLEVTRALGLKASGCCLPYSTPRCGPRGARRPLAGTGYAEPGCLRPAARCEAGSAKAGSRDGGSTWPRRLRTVLLVGRPGPLPLHPNPLSEDKAWGVRFLQLTVSPTHCPECPENPAPLSESDVAGRWGVEWGGLRSSADGDVPVLPIPCLGLRWG